MAGCDRRSSNQSRDHGRSKAGRVFECGLLYSNQIIVLCVALQQVRIWFLSKELVVSRQLDGIRVFGMVLCRGYRALRCQDKESNARFTMPAWGGQKPLIFKDVLESALESDLERIASDLSTCNGMEVKISTDDGRHERVDITDSNAEVS